MSKKISLFDIAKSKFSNKDNLSSWYKERLKICQECPLNSVNKPRKDWTMQERAWVAANLGKPTCLACKCEITAKASLPHATCGKKTIGLEPDWIPIETLSKTANLEIKKSSKRSFKFRTDARGEMWIDFGTVKVGEPISANLIITDLNENISDLSAQSSCGCTIPKLEKDKNDILLDIEYNNKDIGDFTKTVVLSYKQNNINFEKIFKITGNAQ